MTKNVLILKGSPREKGNSAILADRAAAGAKEAGANVESIYLHGLNIHPCDACDQCRDTNMCVIQDDMNSIYPKLTAADAIILATPVYWFTYSAQLKLCTDRWYAFQGNGWKDVSHKKFGILLAYGDTDLNTSGGINAVHTFETMCRYLKSEIVGIVHGSLSDVGDAEKHPELLQQAYDLGKQLGTTDDRDSGPRAVALVAGKQGMTSADAKLDSYFQELTTQEKFSGVVRITRGDQEIFANAYGYASRAWKVPNTLATRFDTASITKLFTAIAVLQQVDAGRLTLDTRAVEYLGLQKTAIAPEVNIHHLLTHSSGIADDADEEAGEDYADLWIAKPNYSVTKAEHFLPQFVHKPANFPPGQGCRYCNCGYILLGLMLEKASGMDYRDYVRQNIFAPAGMNNSGFFHMAEVNENVAEGADPVKDADGNITGWRKNIYSYPPIGTPDGGAHVTAADLDRFLRFVKRGALLSPESTRYFFTPQILHSQRDEWKEMYGPGLWFYVEENGNILFYEKDGQNAGVSGMIRHYPAKDISVVLLSNLGQGAWEPIREIHKMLVAGQFDS
jgi:CubicO group peptidase (beta-lactamase class C family)/multimeric flavodoxin WrbA